MLLADLIKGVWQRAGVPPNLFFANVANQLEQLRAERDEAVQEMFLTAEDNGRLRAEVEHLRWRISEIQDYERPHDVSYETALAWVKLRARAALEG